MYQWRFGRRQAAKVTDVMCHLKEMMCINMMVSHQTEQRGSVLFPIFVSQMISFLAVNSYMVLNVLSHALINNRKYA